MKSLEEVPTEYRVVLVVSWLVSGVGGFLMSPEGSSVLAARALLSGPVVSGLVLWTWRREGLGG